MSGTTGELRTDSDVFDACIRTAHEMIADRGWRPPSDESRIAMVPGEPLSTNTALLFGELPGKDSSYAIVIMLTAQSTASFNAKQFDNNIARVISEKESRREEWRTVHRATLILPQQCTSHFSNNFHSTLCKYMPSIERGSAQLLHETQACFNLVRYHELVPRYERIEKRNESKELRTYLAAQMHDNATTALSIQEAKEALQKIKTSDPVAMYFFSAPGDMLKVTSPDASTFEKTELTLVVQS